MKTALIILGSIVGLMAIYLIYRSMKKTAAYVPLGSGSVVAFSQTPTRGFSPLSKNVIYYCKDGSTSSTLSGCKTGADAVRVF